MTIFKTNGVGQFSPWFSSSKLPHQTAASDSNTDPARKNQLHAAFFLDLPTDSKEKGPFSDASILKGKSQIPLRYPGHRQVWSWSQTCSELEFGLSSSLLARASRSATSFGPICNQDSVMEFGLDQLRTSLRPGSQIARTCLNVVADQFIAKFHYAILVTDRSEAGCRPASSC